MITDLLINIAASFIFFIIGAIWHKTIVNWLRSLRYEGIEISGKWVIEESKITAEGYELSVPSNFSVELKQTANFIKGKAVSSINVNEKREHINYTIEGKIKDRFVYLIFNLDEKKRISQIIFLLEVLSNGEIMEGYMSFYALRKKHINSVKTKWRVK